MKIYKVLLYIFTFVLSAFTAIAYDKTYDGDITNTGSPFEVEGCPERETCEVDVCDNNLTSGIQCHIRQNGNCGTLAYKTSDCTVPLYRWPTLLE